MQGIRVRETGGPEVLEWAALSEPAVGPDEILIEVAFAGVNFIDTYHRSGLYDMALPLTPGLEGAGTVLAVGEAVGGRSIGDRVSWTGQLGSYAERVAVPANGVVSVPDGVSLASAAAVMLQGLTAHYLVDSTFPLQPGHRCLIHAGAGGVGLLLIQMAKLRGAEVFTTVGESPVGGPDKVALAAGAGADHVIPYRSVDFGDAISDIAGPRALDVVYDGVGKDTFDRSLDVLRPRGMMVTFGNSSGPAEPVSPLRLFQAGSLYLTRPSLFDYLAGPGELERRSAELFEWMSEDRLDVRIGASLPLEQASEAHRLLEGRQTTGKVLLEVGSPEQV